ncbi:hypothetical protein M0811_04291 [Anaeramoeba ignava]|uniref:Arb2 domain-containing protein n=1 Tax=Anaeramoeba ignava TaxID=1746090 RepID=A0A9Q0LV44_ANAIG|nr:hypothetical protein M0811_04291 [Anaeramoeba ignava]
MEKMIDRTKEEAKKKLKEMGYYYTKEKKLRQIKNDEKFEFVNQKHYEELGDLIVEYIYEQLVVEYKMEEIWLPLEKDLKFSENYKENIEESELEKIRTNIFISKEFEKKEKLMLLICGSGAVRAGQWARSLCINIDLNTGGVFPFLEEAEKQNCGVIIFNPNLTSVLITTKKKSFWKKQKRLMHKFL